MAADEPAGGEVPTDCTQAVTASEPLEQLAHDGRLGLVGLPGDQPAGRRVVDRLVPVGRGTARPAGGRVGRCRAAQPDGELAGLVLGVDGILQQRAAVTRVRRIVDPPVRRDGDQLAVTLAGLDQIHPLTDLAAATRRFPQHQQVGVEAVALEVGDEAVEVVAGLGGVTGGRAACRGRARRASSRLVGGTLVLGVLLVVRPFPPGPVVRTSRYSRNVNVVVVVTSTNVLLARQC